MLSIILFSKSEISFKSILSKYGISFLAGSEVRVVVPDEWEYAELMIEDKIILPFDKRKILNFYIKMINLYGVKLRQLLKRYTKQAQLLQTILSNCSLNFL